MADFVIRIPKDAVTEGGDGSYTLRMPGSADTPAGKVTVGGDAEKPSGAERVLASPGGRFMTGAKSMIDAGAEYLPWALGAVTGGFGAAPNQVSDYLFEESRRVRQMTADDQARMTAARAKTGNDGFDLAGLAGNVAGGAGMGLAIKAAAPVTNLGRAAYGAAVGGAGGAMTPTGEVDDAKFAETKAAQTALGAAAGGALTPVIGKLGDKLGPMLDKWLSKKNAPAMSDEMIADRIRFELKKDNIEYTDIPAELRTRITAEVASALKEGKSLDGAALIRKVDLDAFGGGTQGQVTRNAAQWNEEFSLRQANTGAKNEAGDLLNNPLTDQVQRVNAATRTKLEGAGANVGGVMTASGTTGNYGRGATAIKSLQDADAPIEKMVDDAYLKARQMAGKDARLQPWQFTELVEKAFTSEGKDSATSMLLPKKVRTIVNQVATGELPFTIKVANDIQSVLSDSARELSQSGKHGAARSVRAVSDALRNTDLEGAAGAATQRGANGEVLIGQVAGEGARDAFNAAKKVAAERFATHKAVPAMKDALDAAHDPLKFPPEKFITKHVIDASMDSVENLSKVMGPEGQQAVRQHLAQYLHDAAFSNPNAKDLPMALPTYIAALKKVGREKLSAFMPEDVVDDLYKIARVNTYVTSAPAGITPNRSGTAMALVNALQKIPGVGFAMKVGKDVADAHTMGTALSPQIAPQAVPVITPALRDLVGAVPLGIGMTAAQ